MTKRWSEENFLFYELVKIRLLIIVAITIVTIVTIIIIALLQFH